MRLQDRKSTLPCCAATHMYMCCAQSPEQLPGKTTVRPGCKSHTFIDVDQSFALEMREMEVITCNVSLHLPLARSSYQVAEGGFAKCCLPAVPLGTPLQCEGRRLVFLVPPRPYSGVCLRVPQ